MNDVTKSYPDFDNGNSSKLILLKVISPMFETKSEFKYYETCRINEKDIDVLPAKSRNQPSVFIFPDKASKNMQFRTRKMNNISQDDLPVSIDSSSLDSIIILLPFSNGLGRCILFC